MTTATIKQSIPTGTWRIDPVHSSVGFEVKHFGVSTFRGRFTDYDATVETADDALTAVRGTIATASIDVKDEQLAGHLRSPDFFDVEAHPEARFETTQVEAKGDDSYRLGGEFTLRGVTLPLELEVRLDGVGIGPDGRDRLSLLGEGVLDRTEYGLNWNSQLDNGALVVGEKVRLVLAAEAIREEA